MEVFPFDLELMRVFLKMVCVSVSVCVCCEWKELSSRTINILMIRMQSRSQIYHLKSSFGNWIIYIYIIFLHCCSLKGKGVLS